MSVLGMVRSTVGVPPVEVDRPQQMGLGTAQRRMLHVCKGCPVGAALLARRVELRACPRCHRGSRRREFQSQAPQGRAPPQESSRRAQRRVRGLSLRLFLARRGPVTRLEEVALLRHRAPLTPGVLLQQLCSACDVG